MNEANTQHIPNLVSTLVLVLLPIMEAFSLLKYWRRGGDGGGGGCLTSVVEQDSASTPTIVTAAVSPCSSDGEDGPYFDLEFTLPEDETDAEEDETTPKCQENDDTRTRKTEHGDETEDGSRAEEESEHENGGDQKFTVESSSILLNVSEETSYSFPVSLLKSATKIRVLLLKFKRSKTEKSENNETTGRENVETQENQGTKTSGKFFTVKFKVEEVKAPLISLFTRDNYSKEKQGKGLKNSEENLDLSGVSDDKKLIQKYLKMVKPLYIRVSKRYVEKLKFSGQLSFSVSKGSGAASSSPCVAMEEEGPGAVEAVDAAVAAAVRVKSRVTQVNEVVLQTKPKVVHKQLGKSQSASPPVKMAAPDRRDDSLIQVQDGIQDAILHCKRSFQRL